MKSDKNLNKDLDLLARIRKALDSGISKNVAEIILELESIRMQFHRNELLSIKTPDDLLKNMPKMSIEDWRITMETGNWPSNMRILKETLGDIVVVTKNRTDEANLSGEECYTVFYLKKIDCYIKVEGFYSSEDGFILTGPVSLVTPKEKTITVYENI